MSFADICLFLIIMYSIVFLCPELLINDALSEWNGWGFCMMFFYFIHPQIYLVDTQFQSSHKREYLFVESTIYGNNNAKS